jgi:hypothetical protein
VEDHLVTAPPDAVDERRQQRRSALPAERQLLIAAGADPTVEGEHGFSAIGFARHEIARPLFPYSPPRY